jgi:hypothetical protein
MAFDASPLVIAVRYVQFIAANVAIMGSNLQLHCGRRTSGNRIKLAQAARQNANTGPGQPSSSGALAKNPPLLHSSAAKRIKKRPRVRGESAAVMNQRPT